MPNVEPIFSSAPGLDRKVQKRIVLNFCKDHLSYTCTFFLSGGLIALFYSISTHSSVEIVYPALLTLFCYLVFTLICWFRYRRFNSRLIVYDGRTFIDLSPSSCEQKEMNRALEQAQQYYLEKLQELRQQTAQNQQFISQWIHNMKTPVSITELVVQKALSGEAPPAQALQDIHQENERQLANLEQILSLLRLQDFSRDYVPNSLDLAAEVRKVINSRKTQFIYNRVFPRLEAPEEEVLVLSDAKWNEVMLDQLVSNAIKYSDAQDTSKNVYFSIERKQNRVVLKIRDEGIGIPEYDLRRVFEPFFTGENGRRHRNATGIGLYTCSLIAEKLGHDIELTSSPGCGTEVTVTYLSKP